MRAIAITFATLLVCGGLLSADGAQAGSFQSSNAKLADKSLAGQAGGLYGIGGSEPYVKYFKSRMTQISRCCGSTR